MNLNTTFVMTASSGTPNCPKCSRGVEHGVCEVLHLVEAGWTIEHIQHAASIMPIRMPALVGPALASLPASVR